MNRKTITTFSLATLLAMTTGCEPDRVPRNELDALLLKLEKSNPRVKEPVFAMCYSVAAPHGEQEYICPGCNERIKYKFDDSYSDHSYDAMKGLESLSIFRNEIKELKPLAQKYNLKVSLDERDFCPKCRITPEGSVSYYLVVEDKEGRTVRTVVKYKDFVILSAFFKGDSIWVDVDDNEYKLKEEIPRLKELLGLEYLDIAPLDEK